MKMVMSGVDFVENPEFQRIPLIARLAVIHLRDAGVLDVMEVCHDADQPETFDIHSIEAGTFGAVALSTMLEAYATRHIQSNGRSGFLLQLRENAVHLRTTSGRQPISFRSILGAVMDDRSRSHGARFTKVMSQQAQHHA